jgi:hypothetical protein
MASGRGFVLCQSFWRIAIFHHFCREQKSHHELKHDNATLKMHPIAPVVFGHHFPFAFSAGP